MTPANGDHDLVCRAQKGDLDAFERLVRVHQDRVYNLLLRLTGNAADAEDLAQDTFLAAFRSIENFSGESRFGSWLYVIALNAARSRGRHLSVVRRAGPVSLDSGHRGGEPIDLASREAPPEAGLDRTEAHAAAQRALRSLEPELREALVLREIEGLDYKRIAELQGVPLGTVKVRIHRARLALREKMRDFGEPRGLSRV